MSQIGNTMIEPRSLANSLRTILSFFHPALDAFTLPSLPFHIRLRLLAFQPLAILTYLLNHIHCHLTTPAASRPQTIHIPVRGNRTVRALLYLPTSAPNASPLPLHIDFHGGAFIGGHPEADHRFNQALRLAGFVVLVPAYRFAPRHPFPAALEDVCDVLAWVRRGGAEGGGLNKLVKGPGVDLRRVSVGGSSAGASLALAACASAGARARCGGVDVGMGEGDEMVQVNGVVTFYAPVCFSPASVPFSRLICSHILLLFVCLPHFLTSSLLLSRSLPDRLVQTPNTYTTTQVDLRIPPTQKSFPLSEKDRIPPFDPLSFMMPLYDLYARSGRDQGFAADARLSPCLARPEDLPPRTMMVVPTIDILVDEQTEFARRINEAGETRVEILEMPGCLHGWLECKSSFCSPCIGELRWRCSEGVDRMEVIVFEC